MMDYKKYKNDYQKPIRMLTLSMLNLRSSTPFWNIGFCIGSVSVEAKLQFPMLQVTAFEKCQECREILANNCCKFGTPGIETVIGDFLDTDISNIPFLMRFLLVAMEKNGRNA